MIKYTSDNNIFVQYGDRSVQIYHSQLSDAVRRHFGDGSFEDIDTVSKVLQFCYDWMASTFEHIILSTNDVNFVFFLFANHESSIRLYMRRIAGEDLEAVENITESALALNRRILKLALETTCDVNYTHQEKVTYYVKQTYIEKLEDLTFIGQELYGFAEHMAENRMIEDCNRLYFNSEGLLQVERKHHYDKIYYVMDELFNEAFKDGIINTEIVYELKDKLQECMNINYDFAGGIIFHIKEHHSPGDIFQTVEPAVLPQNLIQHGVDAEAASNFYDGLTISRRNKLSVANAVYRVNSFDRHMFRPMLTITHNGKERLLIGKEKWAESIMVMATNGFQWQRAPQEWMKNKCFNQFLAKKHDEHDKFLEDEAEAVLQKLNLPFYRHVLSFTHATGRQVSVDVKDIGEMDFVLIDIERKKVIVADCKYNRARYEMVGFSTDYKNFTEEYAPKIAKKLAWVGENIALVANEFKLRYPGKLFDLDDYEVLGLFIVNTPTFYMMNGDVLTITINNFQRFIEGNYTFPTLEIKEESFGGTVVKQIRHPYFRVQ